MKSRCGILAMLIAMAGMSAIGDVGWRNLDDAHHLGGRKTSEGYLQGRVVMVVQSTNEVARMEAIWSRLKDRPFTMIGSFDTRISDVTFPIYREAALARMIPIGSAYVVDVWGNICYAGDNEREATDIVLKVLTDWDTPNTLRQWRRCLDWELMNAPAAAILRHAEFKQDFPQDAAKYAIMISALSKLPDMTELVKLVKLARRVQHYEAKNAAEHRKLIERLADAIQIYSHLKEAKDPQMAREARNALAELTWVEKDV